MQTHQL
jgi:hypothetical protein